MKITIAQGAFYPIPPLRGGGVEKAWFALGQEFARQGHEVTHISKAFGDLPARESIDGVTRVRIPGFETPRSIFVLKFLDLIYSWRMLRVLPEADILVTHTFWLPMLVRNPRVGRLYVHVARFPGGQMRFYRHAARLQTVSTPIREIILRELPDSAFKIRSIPNPLTSASRAPASVKREKILLYVGRIHPEKGLHVLIDALSLIGINRLEDWKLVVIGSSAARDGGGGEGYLAGLKRKADQLGDRVAWVGPVFDVNRLDDYFRRAALFVYPSLAERGETFGLSPLEAMSQGCPALVSDLACFRDFLQDGEDGFVFDHRLRPVENLAAKLESLIHSTDRLRQAGVLAEQKAQNYRVETVAQRYLEDFESLLPKSISDVDGTQKYPLKTYEQSSPYSSPWSMREKLGMLAWELVWTLLCSWTLKPFNGWRLFWLRCFGATIEGRPFVHSRARIKIPWNLTMRDRSCLGDRANAYSLGEIELAERATVAQEAYLCTGTHDFSHPALPLQVGKIMVGKGAFVSARAFVLPGVIIGAGAIVGAGAVVTRNVAAGSTVVGMPAREV